MCVIFSAQGLGGLYQCDYPAAHDSEYKADIDHLPSIHRQTRTHTHTHKESLHHSSFKHKLSVSFRTCDLKLTSSDRINCPHIALRLWLCVCIDPLIKAVAVCALIAMLSAQQVCVCVCVVQPSHNGTDAYLCVAESQVIHHVGREESSSEE